ncbi:MAG: TlpA disulfide reductase family protein [Candidatus Stygibacter australis]|nr:TlpA disulfide reductase family protein [Candidatus Stygibacter australis]
MKRIIFTAIIVLFTLVAWAEKIPDFSLENAEGNEISLYGTLNDSTVVIVDFWATWCGPCRLELPHLDSLHTKYDNVEVLAITTDGRRTMQKAKDYIAKKGYSFTILMDSRNEVQRLLEVDAIPETFIIAPDGEIHYRHTGYKPGDELELEEHLVELLKELELVE